MGDLLTAMVKTEVKQDAVRIKSEPEPTATPTIAELIVPPRSCTIKKELEQLPTDRAPTTRKRIKREAHLVKEEPRQEDLASLITKRVKPEQVTQEPEPTKAHRKRVKR